MKVYEVVMNTNKMQSKVLQQAVSMGLNPYRKYEVYYDREEDKFVFKQEDEQ